MAEGADVSNFNLQSEDQSMSKIKLPSVLLSPQIDDTAMNIDLVRKESPEGNPNDEKDIDEANVLEEEEPLNFPSIGQQNSMFRMTLSQLYNQQEKVAEQGMPQDD